MQLPPDKTEKINILDRRIRLVRQLLLLRKNTTAVEVSVKAYFFRVPVGQGTELQKKKKKKSSEGN